MRNFLSILEATSPGDPGKDKASQLIDKFNSAISLGLLRAGEKLPSEYQLAEMLQVSVPTLRDALAELRADGIIETRRGRYGGSFLVGSVDSWRRRGQLLLQTTSVAELRDLEDHALAVFAASAAQACRRGTEADFQRLHHLLEALRMSSTPPQLAVNDSRFHIEIAVVSQSMHLTHAAVRIRSRLAPLLWSNPDTGTEIDTVHAQYASVIDALEHKDSARATHLIELNLRNVIDHLIRTKLASLQQLSESPGESAEEKISNLFGELVHRLEDGAATIADGLSGGSRESIPASFSVPEVFHLASAVLESFPVVAGSGAMLASPPIPDAPECQYWWAKNSQGQVDRLIMDTTPGTDKFYDYQSMPWFFQVRRDRTPTLDGPYVDYLGYDQYIVTVSVPIESGDGEFLGIFGADIRVGELEKTLVPLLREVAGGDSAVVNAVGRIVVGGAPHLISGELLEGVDLSVTTALEPKSLGVHLVHAGPQTPMGLFSDAVPRKGVSQR